MLLLLIRHGESEDDVLDAYGGWADFHLTKKGEQQINKTAEEIAKLNIKFNKILTSPLLRAQESAQIIATKLGIPLELFEYVKERNTYGLLCGMVKKEAKEKYPWLVEAYENDKYVDGSEREDDIKSRAKKAFELLKDMPEKNIAVLTHGVFLKAFLPTVLNKKLIKKSDGGFILLKVSPSNCEVIAQNGIEVQ